MKERLRLLLTFRRRREKGKGQKSTTRDDLVLASLRNMTRMGQLEAKSTALTRSGWRQGWFLEQAVLERNIFY
jgi:hypothetical protein